MGRLVSAVVLFYALEKLAVLLAVPLLLGAVWLKYKVHRMDGDKWDRYFRTMPNGKYAALFFVFYNHTQADCIHPHTPFRYKRYGAAAIYGSPEFC